MRIVFMGTPRFAVPSLHGLIRGGYDIAAVITQPDRKKDRGLKVLPPPVKLIAQKHGLNVFQFEKIKSADALETLKSLKPDLMVTAAFGQILSGEILSIPPLGCVNVHASLLPEYRGAAPVEWAIINGEKKTGITTMYTDTGLDTGDMILKEETDIGEDETGAQVLRRLSVLGALVLSKTLKLIEAGNAPRIKQDETKASYYPVLSKETAEIGWGKSAYDIKNLCRALDGGRGAYTFLNGGKLKIYKTKASDKIHNGAPGEVIASSPKEGLAVNTGKGVLEILELQLPGSKRLNIYDFLRGRNISKGTVLGR